MTIKKNVALNGGVDLAALTRAIKELESPIVKRERERAAQLSELYPDIRDQMKSGVSKSAIVKTLNEFGMSITGKVFDELFEAEATRRGETVPVKKVEAGDAEVANAAQQGEAEKEGA